MNESTHILLDSCNPLSCIAARVNACERIINNIFRKHFSPFEITMSQFSILMVINKIGPMRQVDLGQRLVMEKSSVNRNLKRLILNKLIEVDPSKRISITLKGKDNLEAMIPSWDSANQECKEKLKASGFDAVDTLFKNLMRTN